MAQNIYGDETSTQSPSSWTPGDTTTFSNQVSNLSQQAPDAGLDTSGAQIQNETAKAYQQAGQTAQNVAAGSNTIAQGGQYIPTLAQTGDTSQSQPNNPTIQPVVAPDLTITPKTDFSANSTYQDPTAAYLSNLFPGGIPQSVSDALSNSSTYSGDITPFVPQNNSTLGGGANGDIAPIVRDASGAIIGGGYSLNAAAEAAYNANPNITANNNLWNQYIDLGQDINGAARTTLQNAAANPSDVAAYVNALQNQLATQSSGLDTTYNQGQTDLANQLTTKNQNLSDYIQNLNTNLQNYQNSTTNLSNVGNLSDAEQNAAATNQVLANSPNGIAALNALTNGNLSPNSRLGVLSQQAQAAAINQAKGDAAAASQNAAVGQDIQNAGKQAQANSYTAAGNTIDTNQQNSLNTLNQNSSNAQQQLTDSYNTAKTNLNNQEQNYVNKAQQTLQTAQVPQSVMNNATVAFANAVGNYLDNNQLNDQQKAMLKTQLESIYRVAVGSNPSADINDSNTVASALIPLFSKLGGNVNY